MSAVYAYSNCIHPPFHPPSRVPAAQLLITKKKIHLLLMRNKYYGRFSLSTYCRCCFCWGLPAGVAGLFHSKGCRTFAFAFTLTSSLPLPLSSSISFHIRRTRAPIAALPCYQHLFFALLFQCSFLAHSVLWRVRHTYRHTHTEAYTHILKKCYYINALPLFQHKFSFYHCKLFVCFSVLFLNCAFCERYFRIAKKNS